MRIEISCDTPEGPEFAAYLNSLGYEAWVSRSTGSYVDGVWTSSDNEANETMRRLWDGYCGA